MKHLIVILTSLLFYWPAKSQSITLAGKNIVYFNEEKKDTLYFTQQGKKFSKKQFVLIDADNNFELALKNKKYKKFIKNKLVLTTNLYSKSKNNEQSWKTYCTQTLDIAEILKLSNKSDITVHTDLYLYLGCHDFGVYISEIKKFFKAGVYTINQDGISDIYISSWGEGDHIYKGNAIVNFYDNVYDFYNKSNGYYEVYPETKKIKINLSNDLKNEKIGIYKKIEKPIEYTFSYEKNGDDFFIKP